MHVDCDDGLAKDLHDFFSFKVPGAKFMPSYKNKWWDGKVYLFSIKTHKIYIGLLPYIAEFCEERQYKYGNNIILGTGTDFQLFLGEMANGNIYYDPGIKLENISTKPKIKKRSQFRIKSGFLPNLYKQNEIIDVAE